MKKIFMLVALVGFLITSCQKTSEQVKPQNKPQIGKDKSGSTTNLTEVEIEEKCKHISYILTEVIKTQGVTQEVFDGVKSGQYEDESILLHDLLNPSQSPILSFQQNASSMKFAQAFQNAFNAGAYMFASNYTNITYKELVDIIQQEKIMIYFPYSENWEGTEKPTLTYNTVEEQNENIGYKPIISNSVISGFNAVTVNDDYADAHAVWIVKAEEAYEAIDQKETNEHSVDSASIDPCPEYDKKYTVQIRGVRLVKQLDGCFGGNSGGSEMFFVRAVLRNPTDKPEIEQINLGKFTRKQIKNGEWKYYAYDFLTPWETKYGNVVAGLYERDKKKKEVKKINGSASVSATGSTTTSSVTKNVEYEVVSKEEILYKNTWERCWFFEKVKQASTTVGDLGGLKDGWRRFVTSDNEGEFFLGHD